MKIDMIVKNAFVFQTYRQCFEKKDFAIAGDRIYSVSPAIEEQFNKCKIIDASGKYIIPGLIDIHMHIESSMTYPKKFSDAVLKYGVTSVVADPHEIANVFGMNGIVSFMKQETTLDIFYGVPSCVPSTNEEIETNGASIGPEEVEQLLQDKRVVCLGEVMNFKDIVSNKTTKIKEIIASCKKNDRQIRIEGHCPKLSHENYNRFIYEGVDSDHTQQTAESLIQKIDLGMFVELQKKSLSQEVVDAVIENNLYESIALITDDTMPDKLVHGHLNEILKAAVKLGMPLEKAIYCATYTPARRMYLDDRGVIAPGKKADFVILSNLADFTIEEVYKDGKSCIRQKNELQIQQKNELQIQQQMKLRLQQENYKVGTCIDSGVEPLFPEYFYHSVNCKEAEETDFEVTDKEIANEQESQVVATVIHISQFGNFTEKKKVRLQVRDGKVCWQEAGLSLVTIFERYGKSGTVSHGFIDNAFKSRGAVATTWSHDSHNLLVIGNSVEDMVVAQRDVLAMQGGYTVVSEESVLANAPLKIGGVISDEPIEKLAAQMKDVRAAIESLGYINNNVIMSISTLALVVSPELKMTDKGLFNVKTQEFESLFEKVNAKTEA